jgi:hypothetical protein
VFHDEVEIEDFEFDEDLGMYFYPCPCGDRQVLSKLPPCPMLILLTQKITGISKSLDFKKLIQISIL